MMFRMRLSVFVILLSLIICSGCVTNVDPANTNYFKFIEFLDRRGKLCADQDTIYIQNTILSIKPGVYTSNIEFIKKYWLLESGTVLAFTNENFILYPRPYNCVQSLTFEYQDSGHLLITIYSYLNLQQEMYPGHEHSRPYESNILVQVCANGALKIIDEDVGLKIAVE